MKRFKNFFGIVTALVTVMAMSVLSFADSTTPVSMLDAGVSTILNDFAADVVPTVLAAIAIIIPAALSLWAIGFGIKKGLGFLFRFASKTL